MAQLGKTSIEQRLIASPYSAHWMKVGREATISAMQVEYHDRGGTVTSEGERVAIAVTPVTLELRGHGTEEDAAKVPCPRLCDARQAGLSIQHFTHRSGDSSRIRIHFRTAEG